MYHLNWIQLTMKLGKENAFVPCLLDMSLEQRLLIYEILLFAEKVDHTAITIFKWTYWSTLGTHFVDIKSMLSVRATLLNIPKWASCGIYKNSGSSEMRLMG